MKFGLAYDKQKKGSGSTDYANMHVLCLACCFKLHLGIGRTHFVEGGKSGREKIPDDIGNVEIHTIVITIAAIISILMLFFLILLLVLLLLLL